mgnify:CR=1 FL=1
MYIKIFPHGKGTGQAAVNYLTRMDYPGRTENPPVVLRGEPELTKALIASQDRQWKFCAGVLSWGPEDHVTPEQEQRLMDDFEQTAFAGLAPDQYAILWVRHSHAGITSCTLSFHGWNFPRARPSTPFLPDGKKTLTLYVICTTGVKAGHDRMIRLVSGFAPQNMRISM